jgi:hypothetical protein
LEHVNVNSIVKYRGHIPRYLDWKLDVVWRRESFRRALVDIPKLAVSSAPLVHSKCEKLLRESSFVVAYYMNMMEHPHLL